MLVAYYLERTGLTKPEFGYYEEERLRSMNKIRLIKKARRIRKEIAGYIRESKSGNGA
ncbi:MAG: hypothetical protein MZU95_04080 [Desulfomicrobium escambiense]|nr:hypothetical protein [Desulfomicrobium escambiense]